MGRGESVKEGGIPVPTVMVLSNTYLNRYFTTDTVPPDRRRDGLLVQPLTTCVGCCWSFHNRCNLSLALPALTRRRPGAFRRGRHRREGGGAWFVSGWCILGKFKPTWRPKPYVAQVITTSRNLSTGLRSQRVLSEVSGGCRGLHNLDRLYNVQNLV